MGTVGPPEATLTRRSQSYSDFHYAVKAVLGHEEKKPRRRSSQLKEETEIRTELDFSDWYHGIEHELLDSSHDEYTSVLSRWLRGRKVSLNRELTLSFRAYQKELELSSSHLDSLLSDTTSTLDLLSSLSKSFKEVEAQTTTFQQQCEGLLREQKRVKNLADDLEKNLKYYNYLEPVTRRLNAPGAGSFVRSKEFSEMLTRLDECLEYMASHVRIAVARLIGLSDSCSLPTEKQLHIVRATVF